VVGWIAIARATKTGYPSAGESWPRELKRLPELADIRGMLRRPRPVQDAALEGRAAWSARWPRPWSNHGFIRVTARLGERVSVWGLPLLFAAGYLVVLVVRFPQLIGWIRQDGDFASAFVLADAISYGHAGVVVMGTQGAWVSLWYGLITHGLAFHRLLWELSPALLTLMAAVIIGGTVSRLADRAAGLMTGALILCASPIALANFTAPWEHNSTTLGVGFLGAFLVWLYSSRPRPVVILGCSGILSVLIGTFLASDALLYTEGLVPFLLAPIVLALRSRDRRGLVPVIGVAVASAAVADATSAVMRSLHFRTTSPPLHLSLGQLMAHLDWLRQGLLRMGNGLAMTPQDPVRSLLTLAAAIVTVGALGATIALATRCVAGSDRGRDRGRTVHITFWFTALVCAAGSYVLTAEVPSDRYFLVAVPAVAAIVPLAASGDHSRRLVAAGATIFILASTVALLNGDSRYANPRPLTTQQVRAVQALVTSQQLGTGYAGYWEAAPLDWISNGKLRVHPITDVFGPAQPMNIARIAAWYPRDAAGHSYVLLAPSDSTLTDRVPKGLPDPEHEYHVGALTLAAYPYNIAAYLDAPTT
jgi:hypothetical protein